MASEQDIMIRIPARPFVRSARPSNKLSIYAKFAFDKPSRLPACLIMTSSYWMPQVQVVINHLSKSSPFSVHLILAARLPSLLPEFFFLCLKQTCCYLSRWHISSSLVCHYENDNHVGSREEEISRFVHVCQAGSGGVESSWVGNYSFIKQSIEMWCQLEASNPDNFHNKPNSSYSNGTDGFGEGIVT